MDSNSSSLDLLSQFQAEGSMEFAEQPTLQLTSSENGQGCEECSAWETNQRRLFGEYQDLLGLGREKFEDYRDLTRKWESYESLDAQGEGLKSTCFRLLDELEMFNDTEPGTE